MVVVGRVRSHVTSTGIKLVTQPTSETPVEITEPIGVPFKSAI